MTSKLSNSAPKTHWLDGQGSPSQHNLEQSTLDNYRLSESAPIEPTFSTESAPLPSTTPPHATLWIRSNGQGHTRLGNLSRFAISMTRFSLDKLWGPIPGAKSRELALRLERMTSEQLLRLLSHFKASNKENFHFSSYLCTNTIQSLDEQGLKAHLEQCLAGIVVDSETIFVFPMYIKSESLLESDHMTVFLAYQGKIEFYDSKGISSLHYKWTSSHSLHHVATIIQSVIYPRSTSCQLLENHNPHQSDIVMCGLFVAAWIHHRVILNHSQREWITKLENTSDEQVRLEVVQLLSQCPRDEEQQDNCENDSNVSIFDFDDEINDQTSNL